MAGGTSLRAKSRQTDFTKGPIVKPVVLFAIPALLGNIFNALYNVVDTIVVGRFVGANALAAVGCCFSITMVCMAVFAGFGAASGVITAQMFGAKQFQKLTAAVTTAYLGGFLVGGSMIVVGQIIAKPLLKLMNTPEAIIDMALSYLRILMCGFIGQLYYYMGANMLRGLGDSKRPTYALVICAVLNIILDLVFVVYLDMGCRGVALATVISQMLSGIYVVFLIYSGNYGVTMTRKQFRIDFDILKMILQISIPSSLNRLVTSVGTMIIQSFANSFGETLVAANSIMQKVDQFALLAVNSFGTALTMFVGQNMGAREDKRCNEGIRKITILIIALSLVVTAVCMSGARLLCSAFVKEEAVIAMGAEAIRLAALFYAFHALQVSLGGVLQGAAATKPIMYISFVGIAARVAMCYLFAVRTGRWQGLVWASNGFFLVVSVLYILYLWKGNWKRYVRVRKADPEPSQESETAEAVEAAVEAIAQESEEIAEAAVAAEAAAAEISEQPSEESSPNE